MFIYDIIPPRKIKKIKEIKKQGKLSSILLVILLIVQILAGVLSLLETQEAKAYTTTTVINETWENLLDGGLIINPEAVAGALAYRNNWVTDEDAGLVEVASSNPINDSKSLRMVDSASADTNYIKHIFPATVEGSLSFYAKAVSSFGIGLFVANAPDGTTNEGFRVGYKDGYIQYYNGKSWVDFTTPFDYTLNQAYKFSIIFDCTLDTYDIYIDDHLIQSDVGFIDGDLSEIHEIWFQQGTDTGGTSEIYLDDITVNSSSDSVTLTPTADHTVLTYGIWTITYNVGQIFQDGGKLRIACSHACKAVPQADTPTEAYYVTATSTSGTVSVSVDYYNWRNVIDVTYSGATPLTETDTITVVIGDTSGGGPGARAQNFSQTNFQWFVWADPDADGTYYKESDTNAYFNLVDGSPNRLMVTVPSTVVAGIPFNITVKALDQYYNPAESYLGTVSFSSIDSLASLPGDYTFFSGDEGAHSFAVTLNSTGTQTITVTDSGSGFNDVSNPVIVYSSSPDYYLYWGNLHTHSYYSDGTDSPANNYKFMRDIGDLDFGAISDHAIGPDWGHDTDFLDSELSIDEWEETKTATQQYNDEGSFVTFLGYEWSSRRYGDTNVYFKNDTANLYIPYHLSELWDDLTASGEPAMTIGHAGGRIRNWNYYNPTYDKFIEIASMCAGRKESWARAVLEKGYVIGIQAGEDIHTGHPGFAYSPHAGKMACYATALTRDALWDAFMNRRCYGTTGNRIIVDFTLNGQMMGSTTTVSTLPEISVSAIGEAAITSISLFKDDIEIYTHTGSSSSESFTYTDTAFNLGDSAYYWVKVVQFPNQIAWSSPIWIEEDNSPPGRGGRKKEKKGESGKRGR